MAKKLDITKPITLESLGTADDPCFGKLHDPRSGDCQRCGDNEFCALAMGQLTHQKRLQVEATQTFKDLEEKTITPTPKLEAKKLIRKRIKEIVRINKKGVSRDEIIHDLFSSFSKDGFTQKSLAKILDNLVEKTDRILYDTKKQTYSWK
jgi:hypothetical protein